MKKIIALLLTFTMLFHSAVFAAAAETEQALEETTVAETAQTQRAIDTTPPELIGFSVDKTLVSAGETVTFTIEVEEENELNTPVIYLKNPLDKSTGVSLKRVGETNTYTGSFTVTENSDNGVWQVSYISLEDSNANDGSVYNSKVYSSFSNRMDLSALNFEVVGNTTDTTPPELIGFSVDKTLVSAGETVTFTIEVEEENELNTPIIYLKNPLDKGTGVRLKRVGETNTYTGSFTVTENSDNGVWQVSYISLEDSNANDGTVYNSKVNSYASNKMDLSALNFEVVLEDETLSSETFIVIFKDGYGKSLSTQKVSKGAAAVEPETPTHELYLFNGWDCDFSNVTSDLTVNATWKLNPNVEYDIECHIGGSFEIGVQSGNSSQTYTITCNEDIPFTTSLTGTGMTVTNGSVKYRRTYTVKPEKTGSYLFYVKGNYSTNTLTYKVRITDHNYVASVVKPTCTKQGYTMHVCSICQKGYNDTYTAATGHSWNTNYTVDKQPTCTATGTKSIHCSKCNASKSDTETAIPAKGHVKVVVKGTEATCTAPGRTDETKCSVCNTVFVKAEVLEAHGHNFADGRCTYCKELTTPDTPFISKVSNTSNGVSITWGKVGNVDEYRIYYRIYNTGTEKWGSWVRFATVSGTAKNTFTYTEAQSGTEYEFTIRAKNAAGISGYEQYSSIQMIKYLAQPAVKLANQNGSVKISWGKVTGASKYRVYYKSGTSWKQLTETTGTSYVDKTVTSGTSRTYTVKAMNGSAASSFGSYTIQYLAQPAVKLANQSSGVKISWGKVTGASKYRVYYKSGTSWKQLTETTGTSYVDKSVTSGTSRTYTVKAMNGSYASTFGSYTIKYLAQPAVKLANQNGSVKISWGKVTGASKYRVYYKSGTSWKQLTETTGTSYVDKAVTSGTSKTYTVKAMNGSYASSFGSYTIKYLARPQLTSAVKSGKNVVVKWKSVTGAAAYNVYRKENSGSWVKIGTVKTTSYTDVYNDASKLTANKTYTYTVRAVNGTDISTYNAIGVSINYK